MTEDQEKLLITTAKSVRLLLFNLGVFASPDDMAQRETLLQELHGALIPFERREILDRIVKERG